ncbi:MAG: hypothetical protein WC471_00060 [Candidatus Woesearchaeota archaeon]
MSIAHFKPILKHNGRNRLSRPKTFKSEDSANAWAKANSVSNYKFINSKSPDSKEKKIRVEYFE